MHKRQKMSFAQIVLYGCIALLVLSPLYVYASQQYYRDTKVCDGKTLKQLKPIDTTYYGTSMLPTLRPDTLLYGFVPKSSAQLREGDIVLLDVDGDMDIVHRVYSIYPDYFLTKGDNNAVADLEQRTMDDVKYIVCGAVWK
jgi:hypothetical protein